MHQLLERGQHWLWEQLESENKTGHQITRRVGDFHTAVAGQAINDLFLSIKVRLRGEFLAGFLRDAEDIILKKDLTEEVEAPRSAAAATPTSSSSSTSSSTSSDGEPISGAAQHEHRVGPGVARTTTGHHVRVGHLLRAEHHGQRDGGASYEHHQ